MEYEEVEVWIWMEHEAEEAMAAIESAAEQEGMRRGWRQFVVARRRMESQRRQRVEERRAARAIERTLLHIPMFNGIVQFFPLYM